MMRQHQKHVLMCTGPRCTENGLQADVAFRALGQAIDACDGLRVKRTRSHCFAVCKHGPVMVVYPEGIWYHQVDPDTVQRIVDEHLLGGRPVAERIFHRLGQGDVDTDPPA